MRDLDLYPDEVLGSVAKRIGFGQCSPTSSSNGGDARGARADAWPGADACSRASAADPRCDGYAGLEVAASAFATGGVPVGAAVLDSAGRVLATAAGVGADGDPAACRGPRAARLPRRPTRQRLATHRMP